MIGFKKVNKIKDMSKRELQEELIKACQDIKKLLGEFQQFVESENIGEGFLLADTQKYLDFKKEMYKRFV